jgi:menaquinone-9 beta-reductase
LAENSTPRIVIVGAGPAGSSAAISLAKLGFEVVVIDKSDFPRDKICGDALSLDVVNQLSKLSPELEKAFFQSDKSIASFGVSIISPGNHKVDIPFYHQGQAKNGFVFKRLDFDHLLFEEMKSFPNISIHTGEKIENITEQENEILVETKSLSFVADLVLGADGAQSIVARKLANQSIQHEYHSAGLRVYYSGVTGFHNQNFIELHFLKGILPGYLWIFPLPNGEANVGIGMLSSALKKKKVDLKKCLQEAIQHHPELKKRFINAVALEEYKGFGLPLGSTQRKISGERFLLLGDAGGLIDPFSGEGIANAIRSGRVAAMTIDDIIKAGKSFKQENLQAYDAKIWEMMWPEFKLSAKLQWMCAHPRLFNAVAKKATKNKAMHDFLIHALADLDVKKQITKPKFWFDLLRNN